MHTPPCVPPSPQDSVEDTKGNNGESGELLVRNLRLIWVSKKQRRTNITIGFNTVTAVNVKDANSRLKGEACMHACMGQAAKSKQNSSTRCLLHACMYWDREASSLFLRHAEHG